MFDISITELLVIGAVALVVIGPERLPKVARTVGHLLGRAQRYVSDVKSDIKREMELDEIQQFKAQMDEAATSLKTSLREAEGSLRKPLEQLHGDVTKLADEVKATAPTDAGPQMTGPTPASPSTNAAAAAQEASMAPAPVKATAAPAPSSSPPGNTP